ncbi:hypothetical protein [Neobacillus sp. SuZ13]|uniref:hypothetical protein n=1 Tax=Neobacillus sp. SuZ13 TaxID=3047875 RepID=UPI0024BF7953|nr:hypothetical protein [Neobacillus sp. SuZ13]WHY65716.1 hypothetical protein QNH17_21885 [Neobacillus sp. SuZ13]
MNIIEQLQQKKPSLQLPQETLQFIPGLWVNGKYFWLQDCKEKVLHNEEIIIKVKQEQPHSKIRYSSVFISNHSKEKKEIKLLAMHYYPLVIQDNLVFVSPTDKRIFHHANNNIYLVNGEHNGVGMKEYTAMQQWKVFTDQIWSSLQKGSLNYLPMAKTPASSIFSIKMSLGPHEIGKMNTWTITGSNKNELLSMEQALIKQTD